MKYTFNCAEIWSSAVLGISEGAFEKREGAFEKRKGAFEKRQCMVFHTVLKFQCEKKMCDAGASFS